MLYSGMPFSTNVIRLLEEIEPSLRKVLIAILEEIERQREETVTRKEFLEFARHTDENFQKVWQSIRELAEAQKRTEHSLEEFKKTTEENFQKVWKSINELAEAQKRTEARVEELAEAQKRTEAEIRKLSSGLKQTREMVGGLSDTVGYSLEDRIFPYMEKFVRKEYGVETEVLDRRNIVYPDGRFDEANIYVEGKRNGRKVYIIGECKARPGKRDIRRFKEAVKRMEKHLGGMVEAFLVGYYYSPEIERYLKERYPEIKAMKSFEFEVTYGREV